MNQHRLCQQLDVAKQKHLLVFPLQNPKCVYPFITLGNLQHGWQRNERST